MRNLQSLRFANPVPPAAILNAGSVTCAAIDTQGADEVLILISLGATDIAATACKLQECETSGGSYADIPSGALAVMPTASDDNHQFGLFYSKQGGRMRYVKVVYTNGSGSAGGYVQVTAILAHNENAPYTAADRGLTGQLIL